MILGQDQRLNQPPEMMKTNVKGNKEMFHLKENVKPFYI